MERNDEMKNHTDQIVIRLWRKIPVIIQVIIIGVIVCEIGIVGWLVTISFIPAPWSFLIMIAIFWLYWRFFSGQTRPVRAIEIRKKYFRKIKLTQNVWKWSLVAAVLLVVIIQSALILTFRLIDFPEETFTIGIHYGDYPLWAVIIFIIMAALEAGIFEEVGYRGYMQTPLEQRYGPTIGIMIVAFMFVILHLHQVWAAPVLFHLFVFGILWGILAYSSNSLLPGIISHTIVDIFSFSYWWSGLAEEYAVRTIFEIGIDISFIFWVIIFGFSFLGFLLVAYKLIQLRRNDSEILSLNLHLEVQSKQGKIISGEVRR